MSELFFQLLADRHLFFEVNPTEAEPELSHPMPKIFVRFTKRCPWVCGGVGACFSRASRSLRFSPNDRSVSSRASTVSFLAASRSRRVSCSCSASSAANTLALPLLATSPGDPTRPLPGLGE